MSKQNFISLSNYKEYPVDEMLKRSQAFYDDIKKRRTVRDFSDKQVPKEIIENTTQFRFVENFLKRRIVYGNI